MPFRGGCLVLLLFAAFVLQAHALSAGERDALLAILQSNPRLGSGPNQWGNPSLACEPPVYYGLTCSNDTDPHILSLCVSQNGRKALGLELSLALFSLCLTTDSLTPQPADTQRHKQARNRYSHPFEHHTAHVDDNFVRPPLEGSAACPYFSFSALQRSNSILWSSRF